MCLFSFLGSRLQASNKLKIAKHDSSLLLAVNFEAAQRLNGLLVDPASRLPKLDASQWTQRALPDMEAVMLYCLRTTLCEISPHFFSPL